MHQGEEHMFLVVRWNLFGTDSRATGTLPIPTLIPTSPWASSITKDKRFIIGSRVICYQPLQSPLWFAVSTTSSLVSQLVYDAYGSNGRNSSRLGDLRRLEIVASVLSLIACLHAWVHDPHKLGKVGLHQRRCHQAPSRPR